MADYLLDPIGYVLLAARRLTRERETGRFKRSELEDAIEEWFGVEIELDSRRTPLKTCLEADAIVQWSAGPGTQYQAVLPMNLAELLERAEDRVEEMSVSKGRRPLRDPKERVVHRLTPDQYKDAGTAARFLGRRADEDGDPQAGMAEIGREHFVWDEAEALEEAGDWTRILDRVRRECREAGKAKSTVSKYVGGLRYLLDLAATREWIDRTPTHSPDYEQLPAQWTDIQEVWWETVKGDVNSAASCVRELLSALARQGYEGDPSAAPWDEVLPALEAYWEGAGTGKSRRNKTRRAYRLLRERVGLNGPEWDLGKRRRAKATTLVPRSAYSWVADHYGKDGGYRPGPEAAVAGDPLVWPEPWDRYPRLVDGPYGLRIWVLMRTATLDELKTIGLSQERHSGTILKGGSVTGHLQELSFAAGWLADAEGVDWAEADLRALLQVDRLRAFDEFLGGRDMKPKSRAKYLRRLGYTARTMQEVAAPRGDEEIADQFERAEELLIGEGLERGRVSLVDSAQGETTSGVEEMKAKARLIEGTWTRRNTEMKPTVADHAHDQMSRIGAHALDLFVQDYGPLAEQLEAVAGPGDPPYRTAGGRQPMDRSWAKRVRNLLLWWDQLIVPYRTHTIVELDRADRRPEDGWESYQGDVHRWKRKGGDSPWHDPWYATGYPHPLARLFLMQDEGTGAREMLLTYPDGTRWKPEMGRGLRRPSEAYRKPEEEGGDEQVPREPFYPQKLGEATYARMSGTTARKAIRSVARTTLEARPDAIGGVTYEELNDPDGVLVPHAFRHALAKMQLMAYGMEQLDEIIQILDHSDPSMVLKVYGGTSAADYDSGATAVQSRQERGVEIPTAW